MVKKPARYEHTAVIAAKRFKSLNAAFSEFKLPAKKQQKFRRELREAGKAVFSDENRGTIIFKLANDNNHSA